MQTTGELIRLMNYVDDISATLRRIHSSIPTLTADDRKALRNLLDELNKENQRQAKK